MPLCYKIDNNDFTLGLWDLTENESQMFAEFMLIAPKNEIYKVEKFKYPSRKTEWMATRLLMYHLLNKVVEIDYDIHGKPLILNQEQCISISHTKGMVAVIIAKNLAGIDIEMVNDRVLRVEERFLSGIEMKQIKGDNKLESLLAYWSAKETLYKISGGKGLDFKKNFYISPFILGEKGNFTGEIVSHNQTVGYQLNYFLHKQKNNQENYLIVYYYN
jgi:4'-phosphopantetheinyl transferase